MRILAIRGANLASLEGSFAIDLEEGPLAQAGVFAITGPTGAGKSTLLDAMCLALFDAAPRLRSAGRVRIGRADEEEDDRITAGDPRALLRKGAASAWAEVDFRGADGRRHRARWEVRRARGRAGGKLQPSVMSVTDLESGVAIAGRKTDVHEAIEERLGLSFDQFRRSVLLAQGDFAAFLDADAKDRAELLERMTGTRIYGLISMEAHQRANTERTALGILEESARVLTLLSDDERALHVEKRQALEIEVRQGELTVHEIGRTVEWHAARAVLLREENEAREARDAIGRQLALAEIKRQELAAYEAARPLAPKIERFDRAAAALDVRERARIAGVADRAAAREALDRTARALAAAEAAIKRAEQELAQQAETIASARALEAAIERERSRAEVIAERLAALVRERDGAGAQRIALETQVARERALAEDAAGWLAGHPRASKLAERWDRYEARLIEAAKVASQVRARETELARSSGALEEARTARGAATERAAELERARASAAGEHASLAAEAARLPSQEISAERTRWADRRAALEAMIGVVDLAQRAQDEEKRQRELHEKALALADRAFEEARDAELERARVRAAAAEAQRMRDRLRAALDLSAHRAELIDGEPCPLCGSPDHPYARDPAFEKLARSEDARAEELAAALSSVEARFAQRSHEALVQRNAAAAALSEAARWARELEALRARYAEAARAHEGPWPLALGSAAADWGPLFAGEPSALLDARARHALEAAREAAARTADELAEEERARREREQALAALREDHDRARELAGIAERELERAIDAERALERERDRLVSELEAERAELTRCEAELGDALEAYGDWRARLTGALIEEARADVAARRDRIDAKLRAEEGARAIVPALEAARADERARARAADEARAEHDEQARRVEALRAQRAFDPEARERGLREAIERARSEKDDVTRAHHGAVRIAAEREAQGVQEERAYEEAERERAHARGSLDAALAAAGLDEPSARARLGRDPRAIDAWRAELAHLDEARAKHEAVLAERIQRRALHEASDPPSLGASEANEALGAAQRALIETREVLYATRLRLDQDDAARKKAIALEHELAGKRAKLAVWESLADLVGSANGAKLRVFAQSLTLELLLEHANHHLAELAPRYALARVPGEDLALQVIDREMGDEVRSIGSLSGGETFLAALAMALGLASLGEKSSHVGSLFIDEGFGALDPASLDVVLAALDALHARGRQVGLISHVPTIAERFGTRVHVAPAGPARSRVELVLG